MKKNSIIKIGNFIKTEDNKIYLKIQDVLIDPDLETGEWKEFVDIKTGELYSSIIMLDKFIKINPTFIETIYI